MPLYNLYWIERLTTDQEAEGSSPSGRATIFEAHSFVQVTVAWPCDGRCQPKY